MWYIKRIFGENVATLKKVDHNLTNGCTVVQGQNLDDPGQESNGSGKSHFIDIAPIAILGTSILGKGVKEVISFDKDSLTVGAILENPESSKKMEIIRVFYSKTRSQELYITMNGKTPEELVSKANSDAIDLKDGDQYILDEIGISKANLLSYYFISDSYYTPFYKISNTKKVEFIIDFSNASIVDKAIEEVKSDITKVGESIQVNQISSDRLESDIRVFEGQKMTAQSSVDNFEINKSSSLDELQSYINERQKEYIEIKQQNPGNSIKPINEEDKKNKNKELSETTQLISDFKAQISHHKIIECPNCNHKFSLGGLTGLETLHSSVNELGDYKVILIEAISKFNEIEKENRDILSNYNEYESRLNSIERIIDQSKISYKRTEESTLNIKLPSDYDKDIDSKQSDILILNKEKSKLEDDLSSKETWATNFENFKYFIAGKPLEAITSYTNKFLQDMGSDLNISISGFKRLKSGKIKPELTPIIDRKGVDRTYASFSGGEKARLNLAIDLALQELLNNNSESGGLAYYQNDELLNPVDSKGIEEFSRSLSGIDKTIMVVTHSASDVNHNQVILIRKENGESKIE
jgi:DNA repair exonuclease SbcCD ATPase subunit